MQWKCSSTYLKDPLKVLAQQHKIQPPILVTFNHYLKSRYSKDNIQWFCIVCTYIGNHHIEALNLTLKRSCIAHLKPLYSCFKRWDELLCRVHMQQSCRAHLKPLYWHFKPQYEPFCRVHMQPSCRAHQKPSHWGLKTQHEFVM